MKIRRSCAALVGFYLWLGLLSGCSGGLAGGPPTPLPASYVPTAIALTVEAGNALRPTPLTAETPVALETPTESPTVPQPVPTSTPASFPTLQPAGPSPTPRATPTGLPNADIQIFKPGSLSKVVSPVKIYANLATGAGGRINVELRGEDGRVVAQQTRDFSVQPGYRINLLMDLPFKMAAVAEAGRLVFSVSDAAGRLIALNSVDLILLSVGEADYNPGSADQQAIVIHQPAPKSLIQGGKVIVSGLVQWIPGTPLNVQLVDEKGHVVGSHPVDVKGAPDGGYVPFMVEVPYQVNALTPVRLSVYQGGDSPATIMHLSSMEIMLSP